MRSGIWCVRMVCFAGVRFVTDTARVNADDIAFAEDFGAIWLGGSISAKTVLAAKLAKYRHRLAQAAPAGDGRDSGLSNRVLCSRLLGHAASLRSEEWDEDHAAAADVEEAANRLTARPDDGQGEALPSHPRANVRPAYTDTMVDLLDAYEQRIWVWAQGCEIDGINQRSIVGDSYNESQRSDARKARSALIQQVDALTTEVTPKPTPATGGEDREAKARQIAQAVVPYAADNKYVTEGQRARRRAAKQAARMAIAQPERDAEVVP